ncbi:hypothetical protein [Plantactinospora soyae]|uniref:Uncharacterized protein n=1 Tax=Plantactinospora soyae TaxID=1544732 RepID=A0A927M764_9ACTN|nr:hypothetical protein [Plantactinospora soyae]MBE1488277.1 hypothetical protein [Plantactinospora soyae]
MSTREQGDASAMADPEAAKAAELVGAVRNDPAARLRLAAQFYDSNSGGPTIRPYRRAEIAFMRWQIQRGVLNPVDADGQGGGSPWWRAVNEGLLRDAFEANLRLRSGQLTAGSAPVERWMAFLRTPTPRTWYRAHNSSIVAGYLAHRHLVEAELPVEKFFMDVALLRVLYADCLLSNPRLALGHFAPLGPVLGDPRRKGTAVFLSLNNILPASYPIQERELVSVLEAENYLGRLIDYGAILPRAQALYEHAADDLEQPKLLQLVRADGPAYAWPPEHGYAWLSRRPRMTAMVTRLTGWRSRRGVREVRSRVASRSGRPSRPRR